MTKTTKRKAGNPTAKHEGQTVLEIAVCFDLRHTDAESVATGFDRLLKIAWGIAHEDFINDYGPVTFGEFFVKGKRKT